MDGSGQARKGVLSGSDLSSWSASYEAPLSVNYQGTDVYKPGFWTQSPSLLQSLKILEAAGFEATNNAHFVHHITETLKLSMADRDAYYGDIPHPYGIAAARSVLLSNEYAETRASLITEKASHHMQPGALTGFEMLGEAAVERSLRQNQDATEPGSGEPTMAHLSERRGDTVHLDVIDRWGNMVSATPSGGWLQSSPVVPGLGMPLNTRAQMFWLTPGLPSSLVPGTRPRTPLSPSMARQENGTRLAFGTPGGDQQDQWQLAFLLRLLHETDNLQAAIDAPLFHTNHLQSSFYPRDFKPGSLMVEPNLGADTIDALKAMGHNLVVAEPWTIGRLTAASRQRDGRLKAAATPRLMQAYAVGR